MKLSSIFFNNYSSLEDLNLSILEYEIPTSKEKIESIGSYKVKTGEYENIKIPLKLRYRGRNIFNIRDQIIEWLFNIYDNKLIFSFIEGRYYEVKFVDFDKLLVNKNTFDIVFECEPFAYALESYIILNNNSKIYYNGTVPGECNIKIYGSGNIQLTINDNTIQINSVNEYVELDSKLLLCLNKDKTSKSRDMIGHFPLLTKGTNEISWSGSVSKVEILPRTAYK